MAWNGYKYEFEPHGLLEQDAGPFVFSSEPVSASPVTAAPSASPVARTTTHDGGAGGDGVSGPAGYGGPSPGIGYNSASTGSTIGGLASMATGIPGLGMVGAGIGTAQDMSNLGQMAGIANPGVVDNISAISHFANAVSNGLAGRSIRGQTIDMANQYSPNVNPADFAQLGKQASTYGGGSTDNGGMSSTESAVGAGFGDETGEFGGLGPNGEGDGGEGDGTVICTELYRQGLMPREIYQADRLFGASQDVSVLEGYRAWAKPVVRLMRRSKAVTRAVHFIASPWAKEMAYQMGATEEGSVIGWAMMSVGIPVCRMLGYARSKLNASRQSFQS
jgi:hypothetical protein